MTTGGRAAARPSRISAGPATASAAATCSAVRRSISLLPANEWLAISPSMPLWDLRSSVSEDCWLPLASVKGIGACPQGLNPDYGKDLATAHCPKAVVLGY